MVLHFHSIFIRICIREVILFTDVKMSIFIYKSTHIVILIPCSHSSTFTFLVLQSPGELRCAALILSDKHLSYKRDLPENFFRKIVRQHHMIPKSNFTFTKSVRQISGDHRRAAAILSDKACPIKVTLQSQTCSNFVRQSLSDKSHTAESNLQQFCPTKLVRQKSCCSINLQQFCPTAPKKGGKLQLLTLPG